MKVIYVGLDSKKRKSLIEKEPNIIVLLFDKWDDYNYKTTFPTDCRINSESVEIDAIKILIEGQMTSFAYLDDLVAQGWDGAFPIPDTIYISTPTSLSFYEQLEGHLGLDEAINVAQMLHDASYQTKIKEDRDALRLIMNDGFYKSLQRERGAVKAYLDGWKLFGRQSISIGNLTFQFRTSKRGYLPLDLRFESNSPLPHDINVLIGPNGVGKSQFLHQLVKNWLKLDPDNTNNIGFTERPNLNQVVVVSYSPFEIFPVDTDDDKQRRDHDVYKYFGLRGRKKALTDSKRGSDKVTLSRDFPRVNAAQSLLNCLSDDQKFGGIKEWSKKVKTVEKVLGLAIDFEYAAVVVSGSNDISEFFTDIKRIDEPFVDGKVSLEDADTVEQRYIPIASDRINELKTQTLRKHIQDREGVVFLKGGKPVHLSSGQRLFSYIVINILGAIRRNSLVLVDEPELFLHPSLEIAFVRMLKSILASYGSKALVATHSLVTVREIPRDCVHVFEDTKDGIVIKTPPFETFGGDVQRISSYVFGDKSLSKPYEEWVSQQLKEFGSAESLIEALGDNVNEELIIQINSMDNGQW